MQVRVPKLKYSARSSSEDNSTFMERKCVSDYLNIPIAPEGGGGGAKIKGVHTWK